MTISPAVTVLVKDANGNTVAGDNSNVTLAITTNPGGGTLSGTTTVAAVNGVATFSNLAINKAGHRLCADGDGWRADQAWRAAALTLRRARRRSWRSDSSRANAVAGMSISPAVTVLIRTSNGNTVTGNTTNVTLAITTNPGGGTLSGTTTVAAVNGVATFSNLSINKAGTGYVLTATDGALTSVASNSFNIAAGAAAKLAFAQQPANHRGGGEHYSGGDSAGPGCQWEHGDD